MNPIYRVVSTGWKTEFAGLTSADFDTLSEFEAFARGLGWTRTGLQADHTGRFRLRPELVGQPTYDKSAGPSWGGEENGRPVIRYETWAAYERLSA